MSFSEPNNPNTTVSDPTSEQVQPMRVAVPISNGPAVTLDIKQGTPLNDVDDLSRSIHEAASNAVASPQLIRNSGGDVTGLDTYGYTTNVSDKPVTVAIPHPDHQITASFPANSDPDLVHRASKAVYDAASKFVSNAAQTLGLPATVNEAAQSAKHIAANPSAAAKQAGHAILDIPSAYNRQATELFEKARQSWEAGNKTEAASHFLNYLLSPVIGGGADKAGEQFKNKDFVAGAGTIAGTVLPFFMGREGASELEPKASVQTSEIPATPKTAASSSQPLVGPAPPTKPSMRTLLSSDRGELTIPGTSPEPPNVPTFYSKAEQVANEKVPNNASGDQILATLRNNGVKNSEIEWMGLDDYLQGKPKVSKTDLQQFIKENQIQLEETTRGGDSTASRPSPEVVAKYKNEWDAIVDAKEKVRARLDALDNVGYGENRQQYNDLLRQHSDLMSEQDRLSDQMLRETNAGADSGATKYEQYTLPGEKSNYKEMLLRLPKEKQSAEYQRVWNEREDVARQMSRWVRGDDPTNPQGTNLDFGTPEYDAAKRHYDDLQERFQELDKQLPALDNRTRPFHSAHFDDPNILAHVRFDNRIAADGKPTLFIEEVQSDMHQQGKRYGYRTADSDAANRAFQAYRDSLQQKYQTPAFWGQITPEERAQWDVLVNRADEETANPKSIPDAPFKSDWHELVMKRMLRHAAENGYDRIAWTTGDQQAARYDLSKHVQTVEYHPHTKTLEAYDHSGKRVVSQTDVDPKDLPDYIGKEAAAKLSAKINEYPQFSEKDFPVDFDDEIGKFVARDPNGDLVRDSHGDVIASSSQTEVEREIEYILERDRNQVPTPRVSGLDLKVGGSWANALYDRSIPNFLKGYTKRWNAKVGTTQLKDAVGVNERYDLTETSGGWRLVDKQQNQGNGTFVGPVFRTGAAAEKWLKDQGYLNQTVHSVEITPAMKKAVLKTGQPLARNTTPASLPFDWQSVVMNG